MISSSSKGTLYGIVAILLWSTIVGLIRNISEYFGAVGGAALIYTTGTLFLILILGVPKLSRFPKRYLFWGGLLFVTYEVCLSLALGFATDRTQAIELGMVNYLWPSFTLALAVILNKQRFSILLIVGLLCAFSGLVWVVSGDNPLTIDGLWKNIQSNPLSYILAFSGAILWAFYSNLTRLMSGGNNGIVPFFLLTSLALWGQYLFSEPVEWIVNTKSITLLLITGAAIGLANAAWTIGMIRGNVTLLATLSYFTPVISTAFSSILLSTALSFSFWQGVMMVTGGSLICWLATRQKTIKPLKTAK
ncbi:aromatic amino acid DMT transporter YddG [Proteus terrae]|uniref:Aromatic amino acid DMT transporter YddG n=1 Tax=Proteus terrae subsp. cibarius TaxID=626774 RepID=A0ABX6JW81_9GAMM|nr:aromatic amino acid DMT transporter YddG [Proteus terrae]QGW04662.1 drug/metabolite DMT transporter permease [Proteus terrae subsp. cibarius]QIF91931.1 aromatic amino acid DMT transporter YddG [Proteus terrae subsp. cibarius]QIF99453.1 aromatic amino acid DMT transporter YddG [Proteus terrae subsp. cibarius]QKD68152.1 aromatic amino acid DMT transporter YddG [Proteus terrae subsp. cibarius]QKD73306.1 aromatic amino acid DMT transporter YddG [Proteus terrae subsp. cibarius]